MSITSKAIYKFNTNSIKIPMAFSIEVEQTILRVGMEPQKTLNSQNNLEK